jgi:hypothetical protein
MCPIGFLMLGSTLQDLPSDSPAACRSACRRRRARCAPAPTHERSSRAPSLPWSATRSSWHCPTTFRRRPGPTDASAGPAPPAPASSTRRRLRQTTSRAWTAGDHADPGHPSRTAACPRRAPGPHFGRTQRTRQRPDTGRRHRTPDTWTLRRPHRTLDSGPVDRQAWTLDARTRHRTPDAGRGHGQGDEAAAGIRTSWAATPSDRTLGGPTVSLWTAPAALGSPCRLGGEVTFQREIGSRRQLLGRSAGVERRLGALLSSDDFGSRVERTATLHPLCRVANRGQAWVLSGWRARCRWVWRR